LSKQEAEKVFMTQLDAAPVNLFLTRMFYTTSFKAWHKQVRINIERKKHEKEQKEL